MLTKNEFCKLMDSMEQRDQKWNALFRVIDINETLCEMSYVDDVVRLLEHIFEDEQDGTISYWIWELCWGADYRTGDVTMPRDGKQCPVNVRTAENLYNYLTGNPDWEDDANDG